MRIGIVILRLDNNYGGILQNWALQQVLKKMGHEPYTIRIDREKFDKLCTIRWMLHDIKSCYSFIRGRKCSFVGPTAFENKRLKIKKKIYEFINRNISETKYYDYNPTKVINDYKLECLIAGSDQIWRPRYNPHLEDQFLGFTNDNNIIKIAYAASFGVSNWEFTDKQEKICKELIQAFDAVSVREFSGVLLCKEHFGIDAVWTLDPTLLLRKADYKNICLPCQTDEKYIFAYILDDNEELKLKINGIALKNNYKVICKTVDSGISNDDSIELWLSLIAYAELIITDSYHGTIFSILFERQFITIVNNKRGSARFETLSQALPISNRIIDFNEPFPCDFIDYNEVNETLNKEREHSISWLNDALSITKEG